MDGGLSLSNRRAGTLARVRFAATVCAQRVGRWFFRSALAEATTTEQFERFSKTYETIVLGVVLFVLGLHAGFLASAFQRPTMAARIVGVTSACS